MTERLSLILALWVVVGVGLWAARRRSPLHPLVVLLLTTGLLGSFQPLLSAFVTARTWRNGTHASEAVMRTVQVDFLVFAVALVLAWSALGQVRWLSAAPAQSGARLAHRDRLVSWTLLLGGGALYGLFIARVGLAPLLDRSNYAEKHAAAQSLGPLLFGLYIAMSACFWAEAGRLTTRQKLPFRLVAAGICVWSIAFLAVRTNAALVALGYLSIFCAQRNWQLRRVRPSLILALLGLFLAGEAFAMARGAWKDDDFKSALMEVKSMGLANEHALSSLLGSSELAHPFYTALELVQSESAGELGGMSYLNAPRILVPLALDPNRPRTLSQRFAYEHYPGLSDRGGGAAFSFLGEAWWNFGPVVGALLLGLALGFAFTLWDQALAWRPHGALARLTPYLLGLTAFLQRTESATVLKPLFSIAMPTLAALALASLLWQGERGAGRARTRGPALPTRA